MITQIMNKKSHAAIEFVSRDSSIINIGYLKLIVF